MEFLRKAALLVGAGAALFSPSLGTGQTMEGVVLRAGLDAEVVYDGSPGGSGSITIGDPQQLAIDPQTGELYFGNILPGGEEFTIIVDPTTGSARRFPFFGNGMAFNSDGSTFYFGLSSLMLGVWYRDINEFRKFTILPGVENVQVVDDGSSKGRLLVANSDYGKNILGVDTVWEVDQADGYYQAVMRFVDGSNEVGVNFAAMDAMAVDGAGNIYTLTGQGKVLIRKTDGSYEEGNSAPITNSGLMQGGMGGSPDGMVYFLDTSSAEVFAYFPDGRQVMVGYGEAFQQTNNRTDGGIISDGRSIFLATSKGKIIRISAKDDSSIRSTLQTDLGSAILNGVITDSSGAPLPGVTVRLRNKSIAATTTGPNGEFQLKVPAGLYHVLATLANYADFNSWVTTNADPSTVLGISMSSFLPSYLAPGLAADIIATKSAGSVEGSSDVTFDIEGNLYSLNHSNGTITKTIMDPETREAQETFIAVKGGAIDNAWFVAVGDDLNIYTSSSNSGLLRLPAVRDPSGLVTLTVDPEDPKKVRDQGGVDRMVSFVTDIDGGVKMSNGDIMFTSGSGGSIIDGFPDGTINTLIRYNPSTGKQSLFSRGLPAGGSETLFFNPDVLKVDALDYLYVTNKSGNVVRVDSQGNGELIWPGDGEGYPEGLSSYTSFNSDGQGGLFLKGVDTEGVAVLRLIDPADNHKLLIVASGLSPSSGFGGFEFDEEGRSVILSEWNFLLRIRATDGRTIAENIVSPTPSAKLTINSGPSIVAGRFSNVHDIPLEPLRDIPGTRH